MVESSTTLIALLVVAVVALALLYFCTSSSSTAVNAGEQYTDYASVDNDGHAQSNVHITDVPTDVPTNLLPPSAKDGDGVAPVAARSHGNEQPQPLAGNDVSDTNAAVPKDCFPKDQLTPQELLPSDANSTWAQVNPCGQGNIGDMNLLTAGHHVGINTVGQTLRNANLQLRSEPPNPQVKVSPWLQSTIEPDTNRRAMEIGGDCASN